MLRLLRQVARYQKAGLANTERQRYPLTYAYLSHCYPSRGCQTQKQSSLFISERTGDQSGYFQTDIDIGERLKDVEGLKKNLSRRGIDLDVDKLAEEHERMMELEKERIHLEAERKRIAALIASLLKIKNEQLVSKEVEAQIAETKEEGKQVKEALKDIMARWWDQEESLQLKALSLPNNLLPSVPDENPSLIQEFFQDKKLVTDQTHMDLVNNTGLVKFSNIGPRSYFLRGPLAELEQSLIRHMSTQLCNHGYLQMVGPDMFKTPVVETAGVSFSDASEVYHLSEKVTEKDVHIQDQVWLRGASYMTFIAFLARNILQENQLPMKLFSVGRRYIPETAANSGLPGLFGALQSIKVSGCCISRSVKDNMKQLQECQTMISDMYRQFKLPYRLVNMPAKDLSPAEQNRIELQIWAPSLQQYIKMSSVSSIGDYGSRRLMIRCSSRRGSADTNLVHMVAVEVCDITRLIALLIEYGQLDQDLPEDLRILGASKLK